MDATRERRRRLSTRGRVVRASSSSSSLLLACVLAAATALAGGASCGRDAGAPPGRAPDSVRHACASCHMPEYLATRHPPHANVRPTECAVCHATDRWRPAVLDHRWPLTGAHARTDCFACHRGAPPVFVGTSRACVACHRADFDRSTFPGHARFPTTCETCHSTAAWSPATWYPPASAGERGSAAASPDAGSLAAHHGGSHPRTPGHTEPPTHPGGEQPGVTPPPAPAPAPVAEHPEDRFPIQSGHHAGIACMRCHDQGGTMGRGNTDCVQCHPRGRFDPIHERVGAYPQGPAAPNFCVDCHRHGTRSRF